MKGELVKVRGGGSVETRWRLSRDSLGGDSVEPLRNPPFHKILNFIKRGKGKVQEGC
jgi:hypothetical protein